jgi:hypothetical protein
MARYKLGFEARISGKLGGRVFSSNGSGNYIKKYTAPNNKKSLGQFGTRQTHATLLGQWKNLTALEKLSWQSLTTYYRRDNADLSRGFLAPREIFYKLNSLLFQYAGYDISTMLRTAPLWSICYGVTRVFDIRPPAAPRLNFDVIFDNGFNFVPVDQVLIISASYIIPPSYPYCPPDEYQYLFEIPAGGVPVSVDFMQEWELKFGPAPLGAKISVKFGTFNINTGIAGNTATKSVIIF